MALNDHCVDGPLSTKQTNKQIIRHSIRQEYSWNSFTASFSIFRVNTLNYFSFRLFQQRKPALSGVTWYGVNVISEWLIDLVLETPCLPTILPHVYARQVKMTFYRKSNDLFIANQAL